MLYAILTSELATIIYSILLLYGLYRLEKRWPTKLKTDYDENSIDP